VPFASTWISAETIEASTGPVIRIRSPAANSTLITPALSATRGKGVASGFGVIATGLNAAGTCDRSQSCAVASEVARAAGIHTSQLFR